MKLSRTIQVFALTICLTFIACFNASAQEKGKSEPIPTPENTQHIIINYQLGNWGNIYIFFGNQKADMITVPRMDLDKANGKRMGMGPAENISSVLVDLLNRFDKEGFELVSTVSYQTGKTVGPEYPTTAQCFLRKRR